MLGVLLASRASDLQRKYFMYRAGLVIAILSTIAMGPTQNVYLWLALRFVSGLSSVAGSLLASGFVLNWLIRAGGKPELGVHFAGMGVGIAVSGMCIAPMTGLLSWSQLWVGLGLLGIAFFLPAGFWMPAPAKVEGHEAKQVSSPPTQRWILCMLAAYFSSGFGYVISATFMVAIIEKLPLLSGSGGWVWVIVGIAAVPSSFFWDRIAARIGNIPALVLCYVLQILSFVFPVISEGAVANLLSAVMYGGTFVGIVSLTLSIIGRCFPANPAKAMAKLTLSYGAAQIIAPAIAGYLAAATGSYHSALLAAAGVMAVGIFFLLAAGRQASRLGVAVRV